MADDASSVEGGTPATNGETRRKSGRATRAPLKFTQEDQVGSAQSTKRKRQTDGVDDGDEVDSDTERSSSESDEDGEPDEEELREKNRKKRAKKPAQKPAAKRPKTTKTANTTLAIRSANAPKKSAASAAAKKKARERQSQMQNTGLYADVFGHGYKADDAAAKWRDEVAADNVEGIRVIVNLVLQVAGSDAQLQAEDIDDTDNIPNKLGDIIAEYAAQQPEDFMLSGKQRQYHGSKEVFADFFKAVAHALHNSKMLYGEAPIWENLHVWMATMSGASFRSFRFTATIASLAMTTGLTEVGNELRKSMGTTKTQLDAEQKKKKTNSARIASLEEEMKADQDRLAHVDAQIHEAFDTVFVNRYRDVDERLRIESAASLGNWITDYRSVFLEGQYLRYLGWLLSDTNAGTRLEILRQLKLIYKDKNNTAGMRGFSEKFRSRIVEMGTRDADLSVRVEAIELLNLLRAAEFLVPEDIDAVGQLIFDSEPRVRKAVAAFFVSNIEDLYAASIDEFDSAEFNEALPDVEDVEDFDEPCKLWIKFKCLAQTLAAQTQDAVSPSGQLNFVSGVDNTDSRYMVATRAIFGSMPVLTEWESLSGYLLYDHSGIPAVHENSNIETKIKNAYKLEAGEDLILLDVLYCAAMLELSDKPTASQKLTAKQRKEIESKQTVATHNLSVFIPQLHSRYGSDPTAAKSILRMHQLYDPDLVNDNEEGENDTKILLDNVNKQFMASHDPELLNEASRALRAALAHESSREAAENKVKELWQELTGNSLSSLLNGQNVGVRGTTSKQKTRQLSEITSRLVHLASAHDCCDIIENKPSASRRKSKAPEPESLLQILLQLVARGEADDDTAAELAMLDDQISRSVTVVLSLYFRWKIVAVSRAISTSSKAELSASALNTLGQHQKEFANALVAVATSRKPLDSVRVAALQSLLDLHVLFAILRHKKPSNGTLDDNIQSDIDALVTRISTDAAEAIMITHEAMEARMARKTSRKNIKLPLKQSGKTRKAALTNGEDIERPPEDSDDEQLSEDSDGDDIETQLGSDAKENKRKAQVIAEKALCEFTAKLVLGVISVIFPNSAEVKARLQVNRTKLGKSYTQVIAYLDEKKKKSKGPTTPVKKVQAKSVERIEPMDLSDDEIEDVDEDDPEVLREKGLADDPIEDDEVEQNGLEAEDDHSDDDDVMGD